MVDARVLTTTDMVAANNAFAKSILNNNINISIIESQIESSPNSPLIVNGHHLHHQHNYEHEIESAINHIPGMEYWHSRNPVADQVIITDVTVNLMTVTIRECKTEKGFFRDRGGHPHDHPQQEQQQH